MGMIYTFWLVMIWWKVFDILVVLKDIREHLRNGDKE